MDLRKANGVERCWAPRVERVQRTGRVPTTMRRAPRGKRQHRTGGEHSDARDQRTTKGAAARTTGTGRGGSRISRRAPVPNYHFNRRGVHRGRGLVLSWRVGGFTGDGPRMRGWESSVLESVRVLSGAGLMSAVCPSAGMLSSGLGAFDRGDPMDTESMSIALSVAGGIAGKAGGPELGIEGVPGESFKWARIMVTAMDVPRGLG
uniref:Uncharacterized protein n=1 Tax=Globodera rostochiensis TaxID=31243 RepID=A0A914HZM0_GLORO